MKRILPAIVLAQFFCTSIWFAGNAILVDVAREYALPDFLLAHITSAIQLGFITGTLCFAILSIADRFSPSKVFFFCSIIAAICNAATALLPLSIPTLLFSRFATGFFLAGIYPVGMKIAADHFEKGLGKSLGFLVGALAMGTALPHLFKQYTSTVNWQFVLYGTSILSIAGGCIIYFFVPNGPFRKPAQQWQLSACLQGFRNPSFRSAAFGYFGHMWELYTFWALVPAIIITYNTLYPATHLPVALMSFLVIAAGGLACVAGGFLSQRYGAKKIAVISLGISGSCCLLSPLLLFIASPVIALGFLIIWAMAVIADSPLFSTLVATHAPATSKAASLTIVNCIGFAITIISIQITSYAISLLAFPYGYMLLGLGPVFGVLALLKNTKHRGKLQSSILRKHVSP